MVGLAPVFIEADNGLGAPAGDVDDGYALAFTLRSGAPVAAVGAVFGNTSVAHAERNNRMVAALCGFAGLHLRGAARPGEPDSPAARWLAAHQDPVRVLALGPLTTVAAALRLDPALARRAEVVLVGGNLGSRGRWPPWWPFEFNLTKDRAATGVVFASGVPITVVPLDVARRMIVTAAAVVALPGPLGDALHRHSRRWFRRARCIRFSSTIRIWDLVAAMAMLRPELVRTHRHPVRAHGNGWLEFGCGSLEVCVVEDFDPDLLWQAFVSVLRSSASTNLPELPAHAT